MVQEIDNAYFENQKTKVIPRSKQQAKFTFTPVGDAKLPDGILDKLSAHIIFARLPDMFIGENDYFEADENDVVTLTHSADEVVDTLNENYSLENRYQIKKVTNTQRIIFNFKYSEKTNYEIYYFIARLLTKHKDLRFNVDVTYYAIPAEGGLAEDKMKVSFNDVKFEGISALEVAHNNTFSEPVVDLSAQSMKFELL